MSLSIVTWTQTKLIRDNLTSINLQDEQLYQKELTLQYFNSETIL